MSRRSFYEHDLVPGPGEHHREQTFAHDHEQAEDDPDLGWGLSNPKGAFLRALLQETRPQRQNRRRRYKTLTVARNKRQLPFVDPFLRTLDGLTKDPRRRLDFAEVFPLLLLPPTAVKATKLIRRL
jgi:hypothetical protein